MNRQEALSFLEEIKSLVGARSEAEQRLEEAVRRLELTITADEAVQEPNPWENLRYNSAQQSGSAVFEADSERPMTQTTSATNDLTAQLRNQLNSTGIGGTNTDPLETPQATAWTIPATGLPEIDCQGNLLSTPLPSAQYVSPMITPAGDLTILLRNQLSSESSAALETPAEEPVVTSPAVSLAEQLRAQMEANTAISDEEVDEIVAQNEMSTPMSLTEQLKLQMQQDTTSPFSLTSSDNIEDEGLLGFDEEDVEEEEVVLSAAPEHSPASRQALLDLALKKHAEKSTEEETALLADKEQEDLSSNLQKQITVQQLKKSILEGLKKDLNKKPL